MNLDELLAAAPRTMKPRSAGLTSVIDTGYGVRLLDDHLHTCGPYVDLAKLGFGTGLIMANLTDKLAMYRDHEIDVCFGGTLFEFFYVRDRLDDYKRWITDLGVGTVEISDGVVEFQGDRKLELIAEFARDFTVLSEVGRKDSSTVVAPIRWVKSIRDELEAGAALVILEGRESGTAGLYRTTGEMRTGLVEEVLEAGFDPAKLVFEAPKQDQQAYLIRLLGPSVNLANIALFDVLACETLRRGLRGDTLHHFHILPRQ